MYLKSLEMQGFKSFPDKTKLTFEGGATIIVGPNGSGKSNISDAMRWVLGEISSKSIRGTKMEDVIFIGSDSRKRMSFAEVSVTFDNTDKENRLDSPYDEVTVTRRYYRSGDSEYFINRRSVRLRDIYELFMNTGIGRDGYSIIGQGKIAEIISRKSDERRSIFEDAAGIAKFRHKRTETERKLAQTEDNMVRVNDVFLEVSAQVGPLEKEAEKAKRAIVLLEAKKKADVQLWLYDTEKLRGDIENADEAFRRSEFELQTAEDALLGFEQQNERLFEASKNNKVASEQLFNQIKAQTDENHRLESEYRVNDSNILHAKDLISAAKEASAGTLTTLEAEKLTVSSRKANVAALEEKLAALKAEHASMTDEQKKASDEAEALELDIATALEDIHRLESEETDLRVRVSVLENANKNDSGKNDSILSEIDNYQKISDDLAEKCRSRSGIIDSYTAQAKDVEESFASVSKEAAEAGEKLTETRRELDRKKLRRDSLAQRIENFRIMEEQLEGYNNSVRFVMKQYGAGRITGPDGSVCGTIYGPLSKVISVDDSYVTAVETALGANLQNIVVADESVAKAAMYALKQAQAGRATFFPLTSMKGSTQSEEIRQASSYRGFVAVADTLVKCDERFRGVVSNLLGRTVVFDNIDNATAMARQLRYRVRAVTLDGQQINVGGSFTGGSSKTKNGILGRAGEIKNLQNELDATDSDISVTSSLVASIEKKAEKLADELSSADEKLKLIAALKNTEVNRLEQLRAKLDANNTLIEKLRGDLGELSQARVRNEDEIKSLTVRTKEVRKQIEEISAFRAEKDIEKNEQLSLRDSLGEKLTALYVKTVEVGKDIESEQALLSQSEAIIEKCRSEIAVQDERITFLEEKIASLDAAQTENRRAFSEGEEKLRLLNSKRSLLESDSFEFERKLNALNAKTRDKMNEKENIFREYTKWETKLASLREAQDKLANRLSEEHGLTRSEAVALGYPQIDAKTRPEVQQIQTDCRNKLRSIGNVDLDSVEKYKEIKARYDYMSAQIEDLDRSKAELQSIIEKIDSEMKTTFVEAFDKINENFDRVFRELFGGGSAQLLLTEPDDVLNSGIEIKAAPPGKIIKSLMQLSGGEQSFIAIALFFAIIQVNPTPFCILDEIEAALDEVNVARFAEYIKRYSDGTQFVIITHRRGTMEAANRLYGVTMPEHGISKVLALDVGEISKKKGDSWDEIFG